MKRFVTVVFSLVLSATLCMPLVSGYAECNSEDSLLPYRNAFDEFNSTHGTNYGFATDEQLSRIGMDYQEVEDFYTAMTLDEFSEYLETLYVNDMEFMESQKDIAIPQTAGISADTMPYYIKEEEPPGTVIFSIPAGEGVKAVLLEN